MRQINTFQVSPEPENDRYLWAKKTTWKHVVKGQRKHHQTLLAQTDEEEVSEVTCSIAPGVFDFGTSAGALAICTRLTLREFRA